MGKEHLSKLYMGNLHFEAREVDIRKFLGEHGISARHISSFSLKKGFAVISVSSQAAADTMIDKIHGMAFQGNKLILEPSFSGTSSSRINTNSTTTVSTGNENPLKILIPTIYVGAVIGRGGASIKETTKTTGARINVLRNWPDSNEKIIAIIGSPSNCSSACKRILELCELEQKSCGGQEVCLKIFAADTQIGRIIGKEGKSIKKIMQDTQTKIHVSNQVEQERSRGDSSSGTYLQDERIITIRGTIDGMVKAESLISSKLQTSPPSNVQSKNVNNNNYKHYSNTDVKPNRPLTYHPRGGSNSHINNINNNYNNNNNYQNHNNYPINFRSSGITMRPTTANIPSSSFTDSQFYPMSKNPVSSGMDLNNMYTVYSRGQY